MEGKTVSTLKCSEERKKLRFSFQMQNIRSRRNRCSNFVASRQVWIPHHRGIGRKCGRGFGELTKNIGRKSIPFFFRTGAPAETRVNADLLEFSP